MSSRSITFNKQTQAGLAFFGFANEKCFLNSCNNSEVQKNMKQEHLALL
jgi:hypothetical protein